MRRATTVFLLATCWSIAEPAARAAEIGTRTNTNAQHVGRRGVVGNTISVFNPATSGTIRTIHVTGTLTSTNVETWAKHLRVQPVSSGLATGQGYFQFSDLLNFTGTIPVSATIYVPGGAPANQQWRLEAYSPDSETTVPGVDGLSTLTYSFDDAFAPGSVEFGGTIFSNDPTFNRLVRFFDLELSAVGTNVYYDVQPFHVSSPGRYSLVTAAGFNSYVSLYGGVFNPASPLLGAIEVNDEGINVLRRPGLAAVNPDTDTSGTNLLLADLQPGVQYFFVTSGYGNGNQGFYNNLITGPGGVTLGEVPEPAFAAAAGLLCLAGRRRR